MANGEAGTDGAGNGDGEVVLTLSTSLRSELKDPFGPVFTDAEELLAAAGEPILAVGDVVTYHLLGADRRPDVAVVDGYTERTAVDEAVARRVTTDGPRIPNPAATLTVELLRALVDALAAEESRTLVVAGEEDLATLPAILAAPTGASVVYGQPGEGMVLVTVDAETRDRARRLVERMDGDPERALSVLETA